MARILVVEDDPDIASLLAHYLQRAGFEADLVQSGSDVLPRIKKAPPDLLLLDLMLPGLDGLAICRAVRSDGQTASIPIIMVTAKGEEADIILGLGVGADDYAPKPFSPKELIARIRAVLRRSVSAPDVNEGRIVRDGITIDSVRHEILVDGEPVVFTATEFRLLVTLATHPGRVFSRDYLVGRVIGEGVSVIDRTIDVHVQAIRKKLGARRDSIETIRGVGYRFRDDG